MSGSVGILRCRPRSGHGLARGGHLGLIVALVATAVVVAAPGAAADTDTGSCGAGVASTDPAGEYVCTYTTLGTDSFTVPVGAVSAQFELFGAQGVSAGDDAVGGLGGRVTATLPLIAGEVLQVNVGAPNPNVQGGAADVRRGGYSLAERLIVAGAGGHGGRPGVSSAGNVTSSGGPGGPGGFVESTAQGVPGVFGTVIFGVKVANGGPGANGIFGYGAPGGGGASCCGALFPLGQGGSGGRGGDGWFGGGGGGGGSVFLSGGSGGTGGRGGQSFVHRAASTSSITPGVREGDPMVTITYTTGGIAPSGPVATTTAVTSSDNPSVSGQAVWLRAEVSAAPPATGFPSGTVQFEIDGAAMACPSRSTAPPRRRSSPAR